jgi:hypothetical protein
MQQALDALEVMRPACFAETTLKAADTAITALRDRLVQTEQGCPTCESLARTVMMDQTGYDPRPWVGLTDEEIGVPTEPIQPHEAIMFARVIEALIKDKNK